MKMSMKGTTTGDSTCQTMIIKMGDAEMPPTHSKEDRAFVEGSVEQQGAECDDAECSQCGAAEKETQTSAAFDADMAKFSADAGCILMDAESGLYALINIKSGGPPSNPCSASTTDSTTSHEVTSRLHKAVSSVALLSVVFAMQQNV
eukprot:gnl/TRDRNA2_/TRDRNA2_68030_c0_seq1.p1 gnl/TRDRNA2_/TRDRNA2_68030_c0~~gnl/TRDRNA2_/TRDRNA2_68030_c0_seq1.p1  ORF type:complete len:147 (+),score=18.08 gnl/TRDRNA2_/TRDRNA2_68030_c0_seq1:122-562(+)